MKMSTEDMPFKANAGADPVLLKQGYKKLDGGPERCRDENLNASQVLLETDNGGFLGRMESPDSESTELGKPDDTAKE